MKLGQLSDCFVCVMLETASDIHGRNSAARSKSAQTAENATFFLRPVLKGEKLYAAGERKAYIYRVEAGTISVTWPQPGGTVRPVETVEANSFFGLGYLDVHLHDAFALNDVVVSCWPLQSIEMIVAQFAGAKDRQDDAVEREFAHRRAAIVAAPPPTPSARLATFLSTIARMNMSEGRDPHVIGESMRCPIVADYLKISIDTLSHALIDLKRAGLVTAEAGGRLRLHNLHGLESFGSATSAQMAERVHAI